MVLSTIQKVLRQIVSFSVKTLYSELQGILKGKRMASLPDDVVRALDLQFPNSSPAMTASWICSR